MEANPVKIFIAYSRLDEEYLTKLRNYLKPLEYNRTIQIWYDGEIVPGTHWETAIKDNLQNADIILLMVSDNSFASDYFYGNEMADALARHEQGTAIVIPIILKPYPWDITKLQHLQALPKDGKPISTWAHPAEAYTDIVRGLNRSIELVKEKQAEAAAQAALKKQEQEAERLRQIAAAKEQQDLKELQRQAEESKKRQQIEAERQRKAAQEQERLRQIELQKEREKLAAQKAQAEQERLTNFKHSLLEADKALLHQEWTSAIAAFRESLQYYQTGDHPDKAHIQQQIKAAQKEQFDAFKKHPKTRYVAMGSTVLLLLFLLIWAIPKAETSTSTAENDKISPQVQGEDTLQNGNSPFEMGQEDVIDSIAQFNEWILKAEQAIYNQTYQTALAYIDTALTYQANDTSALQLRKKAQSAQKNQSEEERKKAQETAYKKTLQIADTELVNKNWVAAKSQYEIASALQPNERYPKDMLKKIAQNEAKEKKEAQNNQELNRLLKLADSHYNQQEWTTAKSYYQQAAQYKNTQHIKDQIAGIDWRLRQKEKTVVESAPVKPALHPEIQQLLDNMVTVQGGTFQMGSNTGQDDEKPMHPVTLSTFQIAKYEVTQAQWKAVMGENPSYFKDCDNCPVEQVSWNDIQEFLKKLNAKTGKNFRLPTEAEWEFAARGGNKSGSYTYAGSNAIEDVAWWYGSNSSDKTHPVGRKKANELGLYDMSGNVYEWCNDWYDKNYYANSPSKNPRGATSGTSRVLRGGSWYGLNSSDCRVAYRDFSAPAYRGSLNGFRLAQ